MLSTYELSLVVLSVTIACSYAVLWLNSQRRQDAIAPLRYNPTESQRRLATLIDSLPGIVFSASNNPNWSMMYLSEGCFNLTGYHSSELVGTQGAYNAITHPEDLPNVLQSIDTAIAARQPYVVEYRIKTKCGQHKWFWEKGSGVFSDSGQLLGLEGFITDITNLKDSQEALRQAEAKYRSIFENAIEGIFQTTIDGNYLSANPALARIYGYESAQATIAELTDLNKQLYVEPNRRQEFVRLMQHGAVSGFESKVYRRDGSIIWISENVRAVKDANGAIYYEGTVEDISDRKQLHENLESRVEERTAQLSKANHQLRSEIAERRKAEQEVRLLQAMTQAISESPDFHSALGVALQKVCEFTGWSFGEAWIPQGQTLTCSPAWYSSDQKLAEFRKDSQEVTFAPKIGLPGRVWASHQPEWIEDVSIEENSVFLRASSAKKVGIKAGLGVPIIARLSQEREPEVLAVLVFFTFESCPEDKRQVDIVSTVATSLDTLMQRKRAESALRESEERYRAVVEQTSEGICLIDTETKYILQTNAAFERMHGYTWAELVQLQLYDLVDCDREIVDSNILQTLQKQHHFINEVPHRRKNGSLLWAEVNVSWIFYDRRSVLCASVRDITARRQAQLALHSSLATNRALINAIPDLMFRLTQEGVYVNFKAPKDSDLLLPPDRFLGKNVYEVMPLEIAEPTMHYIKQALSTSEVQVFEYQLQLDGILHDYEARIVVSAENEVMAIIRDITERKRAEADVHYALAKEKELGELKSRFVTMTSHEFRTPLTTILSSAELLQKYSFKWSEEKKLQHFWRIQTAVKHMTKLLEDVLLIGKAEAEKLDFQPNSLDLVQFCLDLVDEIQIVTDKHEIIFVRSSDRLLGQMDEKLLRHIFSNLLVNAVKYSPQGGEIRFELDSENDTAIFRVRDCGIGIPKSEQTKLFDSFHRASNVGTISGTGLGLAIVKKSLDLHAGRIEVESEVGVGTKFVVFLPLNRSLANGKT